MECRLSQHDLPTPRTARRLLPPRREAEHFNRRHGMPNFIQRRPPSVAKARDLPLTRREAEHFNRRHGMPSEPTRPAYATNGASLATASTRSGAVQPPAWNAEFHSETPAFGTKGT